MNATTPEALPIPSLGVEEEYQLVDRDTGRLTPDCKTILGRVAGTTESEIQHELHLNQIEMASPVCETLDDARRHLEQCRRVIGAAAGKCGAELASAGTHPMEVPIDDDLAPKERYRAMVERYQTIARDLYIFGCHVHVSMPDRDVGVGVMNRCRVWLPLLQALTANSPFWDGEDTGYDSYRRELWVQWPMAGPPPRFDSAQAYDAAVGRLVDAEAIKDATHVYWDIRLPDKVPPIEFRAADAITDVNDTVGYCGLVRAMVMAATDDHHAGVEVPEVDDAVLRYALWHAARYGTGPRLCDAVAGRPAPMQSLVDRLLEWVGPSLDRSGDGGSVRPFVERTMKHGNGAKIQRDWAGDRRDWTKLVTKLVSATSVDR